MSKTSREFIEALNEKIKGKKKPDPKKVKKQKAKDDKKK